MRARASPGQESGGGCGGVGKERWGKTTREGRERSRHVRTHGKKARGKPTPCVVSSSISLYSTVATRSFTASLSPAHRATLRAKKVTNFSKKKPCLARAPSGPSEWCPSCHVRRTKHEF